VTKNLAHALGHRDALTGRQEDEADLAARTINVFTIVNSVIRHTVVSNSVIGRKTSHLRETKKLSRTEAVGGG